LLPGQTDVTEYKMFGGLAFLIGGHMAIAASGKGRALVRVDPATSESITARTNAEPAVMRGRVMKGSVRVEGSDPRTKRDLVRSVKLGTVYARSLPPKR
jgi:TfoX N-terminal domain